MRNFLGLLLLLKHLFNIINIIIFRFLLSSYRFWGHHYHPGDKSVYFMPNNLPKPLPGLKKALAFFAAALLCLSLSAQPVIKTFSPSSGPTGTLVNITGSGFNTIADSNIIYFGGIKTKAITASSTKLTVKVPAGATTSLITVTSRSLTTASLRHFAVSFANGDGMSGSAFTLINTITTAAKPYALESADLDCDGKVDLILVNQANPYFVSVYRNTSTTGNILFDAPVNIPAVGAGYDVKAADLDGDGLLDLVVTNQFSNTVTLYRNTSTTGQLSFDTGIPFTGYGYTVGVDVKDLNADGKPEVIMMNGWDGKLSIFPNTSTTGILTLGERVDFVSGGDDSESLCSADVNGDGLPDVIATGFKGFTPLINRSKSGGRIVLAATPYIKTTGYAYHVDAADIDEDGKSDLLVSIGGITGEYGNVDGMGIFRNTTTDTAIAKLSFSLAFIPATTYLGRFGVSDLDGDGHIDLTTTGSPFSVIRNTSKSGTITTDRPSSVANNNSGVLVADFDLDGRPDLASINWQTNALYLFKNSIEGPNIISVTPESAVTGATITLHGNHFTGTTIAKLGSTITNFKVVSDSVITAVIPVEVVSDSIEIVTATRAGVYTGYKFLNAPWLKSMKPGYGSTGSLTSIKGHNFTNATAVSFGGVPPARFTIVGDTLINAIIGKGSTGAVTVTSAYGTGSLAGFTYSVKGPPPVITSFAPLTGPVGTTVTITGANFGTAPSANIVYFGAAKATVLSATATELKVLVPAGATYQPLKVITNYLTGTATLSFGVTFGGGELITDSTFNINNFVSFPSGTYVTEAAIADFDGDGLNDAAAVSFGANNMLTIARNNSANNNLGVGTVLQFNYSTSVYSLTTGDLNSDGKPDLAVAGAKGVYILKNTSIPGQLSFDTTLIISDKVDASDLAIVDLNNDGKPDLVSGSNFDKYFYLYRNVGANDFIAFASPVKYTDDRGGMPIRIGDMDGDGKIDLIQTNYEYNTISVFRNTSLNDTLSLAAAVKLPSGGLAMDVSIGDLDGDGKTDIVACYPNQDNHIISVYKNNSTQGNLSFDRQDIPTALFGYSICMGDLDGDGKPDLGATTLNGFVALKNLSTPGSIKIDTYHRYGDLNITAVMGIADFSGDGKPDVIGFNNGTYTMNILPNLTGKGLSPLITSFTPAQAEKGDTIIIKGTRFSATQTVTLGGTPATFIVENDSLIRAVANDGSSGNVSITTPSGSVTKDGFVFIASTPVINEFYPASATTGMSVTLLGKHFTNTTNVLIGGVAATSFTILTDSTITAIVNGGASGPISVITPQGNAFLDGFAFHNPAPRVTYFTPSSAGYGDTVTIHGAELVNLTAVSFGESAALSYLSLNDSTVLATVDRGNSGTVKVVSNGIETSLAGFTYKSSIPAVLSFAPAAAATGDPVTITGHGLINVNSVKFGTVRADSFIVVSDSTIIAYIGYGGNSTISVNTDANSSGKNGFTYLTPVFTNFSPAAGTIGDTVTIYGSYLKGVQNITFGGMAPAYEKYEGNVITAVLAKGASGNLTAYYYDNQKIIGSFTYNPFFQRFYPTTAATGTTVKIAGIFNGTVSSVTFGGFPASSFKQESDTVITAIVGEGHTGNVVVTMDNIEVSRPGFTFDLSLKPVITSVTPPSGTTGAAIRISGSGLNNTFAVTFGGQAAAGFTTDSTFITAILGTGASGDVVVSTPYGEATYPGFTFTEPAKEIDVYPNPVQNGIVVIKHPASEKTSYISFRNQNGMLVLKRDVAAGESITTISGLNLMSGIYQVIWTDNSKKMVQRIVIP